MTALDSIKALQFTLGFTGDQIDGKFGANSMARLHTLLNADPASPWPPVAAIGQPQASGEIHAGIASSFADPKDVAAFKACKAEGKTDEQCFAVGDNGIGKWVDSCVEGTGPACALPPEDWQPFSLTARKKKVLVTGNGKSVVAELRDTMPHKANIHNGAIIDLSPDAVRALGWEPPIMNHVTWQWV